MNKLFVCCNQSTGRIGKSTFLEGYLTALNFVGQTFAGLDADRQHQTLSRRYPKQFNLFDATKSTGDFARMVQAISREDDLVLVDFPAQATDFLLRAFQQTDLLDYLEKINFRLLNLIFQSNDRTAKESAEKTRLFLGDRADYLLIKNLARFDSDRFNPAWFQARGAQTFVMPEFQPGTVAKWEYAEHHGRAFLSLDQAIRHPGLVDFCQHDLAHWRDRFLTQVEDYAEILLPDPALIKGKLVRRVDTTSLIDSSPFDSVLEPA